MSAPNETVERTHVVDPSELDPKSVYYLRALEENGGEATTSDIRQFAGLSKSEVHYRHDKLTNLGLVETESPTSDDLYAKHDGKTPKVSRLTDAGRAAIENDELVDDVEDVGLKHLKKRVEGLGGRMKQQRDELETRLRSLESTTEEIADFADDTLRAELETNRTALLYILDRLDELERRLEEGRES